MGAEIVNIFEKPLGVVIHQLVKLHFRRLKLGSTALRQRIRVILANLVDTAKSILDCVTNDDPTFEPTAIGLTKFIIMSPEEMAVYEQPLPPFEPLGRGKGEALKDEINIDHYELQVDSSLKIPKTYDYRSQGVVSPVKDQGQCGTCFLFGSMASIESSYMLKYNRTDVVFSEMDLFSCLWVDKLYKSVDCSGGGAVANVFKIAQNRGLTVLGDENGFYMDCNHCSAFPYDIDRCGKVTPQARVTHFGYLKDIPADEKTLKRVLLKYGPISTYFRSKLTGGQKFGRLLGKSHIPCDTEEQPNHVMTIVGWDEKYYIIKNSYGNYKPSASAFHTKTPWGVDGYLYLRKDLAEGCGIFGRYSTWFFPEVKKEGE